MNFLFVCGLCDTECVVWGEPCGFWTQKYRIGETFECWWCGEDNWTPDGPWTPADD